MREQRQAAEVERAVARFLATQRDAVARAERPRELVATVAGEVEHFAGEVVIKPLAAWPNPPRRGEGG